MPSHSHNQQQPSRRNPCPERAKCATQAYARQTRDRGTALPWSDLSPLLDLLVDNEEVLKVFHAGGQDVEIIYNLTGRTPHPIFDTQIAMMAVSQSEQIGYSNLVESWLGFSIDKGARFTDWSRRPLTRATPVRSNPMKSPTSMARLLPPPC